MIIKEKFVKLVMENVLVVLHLIYALLVFNHSYYLKINVLIIAQLDLLILKVFALNVMILSTVKNAVSQILENAFIVLMKHSYSMVNVLLSVQVVILLILKLLHVIFVILLAKPVETLLSVLIVLKAYTSKKVHLFVNNVTIQI